ncbi:carboxylesterase/lipase family protein [Nonomuraea pusilla]|uniref:Para-nitrobenzyl esterase n=1 Tax=Nonomuraea pusilla TaxID=46177 RepID=A0A1H8CEA0_9ACTN|nr:carboxylesterase family protein [Nonomuraea pusilla]SEM93219.1 para-nitrobenzyl esterase [Nonomuraea pusilla]
MDIIAVTRHGRIRGRLQNGIQVFRGIPYAAPPFGAHRFRAPAPVEPWEGVRDASEFGPTAPKRPYRPPLDRLIPEEQIPGDECLNLNVWTPGADDGARPVMVWIHGGSLRNGSSSLALYDGHAFARDGVVLVSINYRLGVEGFGVFPDAPDNRGLLDQIAALEWVRDNIAAFGGDPGNVTAFGESAGAISIGALLTSPRAKGLFHRAIMQSGPPHTVTREEAARIVKLMAAELGVPATAEAFAAIDRERLLDAQVEVVGKADPITGGPGFHVVTEPDAGPVEAGLLIGANREEYRLWFVPTGAVDRVSRLMLRLALLKLRVPGRAARLYRSSRPGAKSGEILGEMATDLLLRAPLNRLADSVDRAHVYEFAWRSEVMDLRACHGLEIGFVFDNLRHCRELAGDEAPQELADTMHRAWIAFAATGDPGWQRWDSSRPVMVFDSPGSGVVHAPRDEELRVWLDRAR